MPDFNWLDDLERYIRETRLALAKPSLVEDESDARIGQDDGGQQ